MKTIYVDSVETYAKLNYLRDRTTLVDGEPLFTDPWGDCEYEYIMEANADPDMVLTGEDVDNIIAAVNLRR